MKSRVSISSKGKRLRIQLFISYFMLGSAVVIGALTWVSFVHEKLYSPIGILASDVTKPGFYIGISIYITIATTLLTSALIRLALSYSK